MTACASPFFVMTTPSTLILMMLLTFLLTTWVWSHRGFKHLPSKATNCDKNPHRLAFLLTTAVTIMCPSLWQSLKKHCSGVPTLLLGMMASIMPWLNTCQITPWHFFSICMIESGLRELFLPCGGWQSFCPSQNLVWLNYRPIALTSCLCKLQDKMVNDRLTWQLEHDKVLHSNQYDSC